MKKRRNSKKTPIDEDRGRSHRPSSPGGCGGVFTNGVAVPAGRDGRNVDRPCRAGAVRRILHGVGIEHLIDRELPAPGSAAGYKPSASVAPLVLTLAGGGRTLEDMREVRSDDEGCARSFGWRRCQAATRPGTGCGGWAARDGGLVGLQHVNRTVFRRLL